jgi:hypothetical protein
VTKSARRRLRNAASKCVDQIGQNRVVQRYELWQNDEGLSFFPDHNQQARDMAEADGQRFRWECTAKGLNAAHQLLYDYLDFGVYRPMLQDDGTPYPQDEDDDYVAPGAFNG